MIPRMSKHYLVPENEIMRRHFGARNAIEAMRHRKLSREKMKSI